MNRVGLGLIAIIVFSAFSACKKGENDPFLSLNSRKARMHGNWEISAYDYADKNTSPDGDYTIVEETFDGNQILKITEQYFEQSGNTVIDTTLIEIKDASYTFDKNGTWTRELITVETWTDFEDHGNDQYSYDTLITSKHTVESGDWSFLNKVKGEYKNKERIVMNVLSRTKSLQITSHFTTISSSDTLSTSNIGAETTDLSNYYSGEVNSIIEIDQLKKKEMIFIEKRRNSGSLTVTPNSGIATTSEDDTFYSESVLTLGRK